MVKAFFFAVFVTAVWFGMWWMYAPLNAADDVRKARKALKSWFRLS